MIRELFSLLTKRERRNLFLLFAAIVVMAGLEVVSVASIMPFLSVASDPGVIHTNEYLAWAYQVGGFTETSSFLIALGTASLVALVVSNGFIVLTTWAMFRYVWGRNHSLSRRLLRSYLGRPYEYFLTHNTAELGKNVLEEVREITTQMLSPALKGTAKGIVALAVIGFLVFVNPVVAVMISGVLGLAYAVLYALVRERLSHAGAGRVQANTKRYEAVNEAFGGIKAVKLSHKEPFFVERYADFSKRYAKYQALYQVINRAPRYVLEAVAFGGIIIIAVYLIGSGQRIRQVIPILGLYAFAGYRLMPALQQAFRGLASARFNIAALRMLLEDLQKPEERGVFNGSAGSRPLREAPLRLERQLQMYDVGYRYPGAAEWAVRNVDIRIEAYSTVGFVGRTGSGKTTVIDLIVGLLSPVEGEISVDESELDGDNIQRWQKCIGYVPQEIYLSDDTIANNIAFGLREEGIDMDQVREAARKAQLYSFVEDELPDRWDTVVGERGVKLSGGQRQRIGIARALYRQPSVLVLDEGTSSLDQATEANVMEAIRNLEESYTIIMIAHRLRTVEKADKIILLENGRKVGEGKYRHLVEKHPILQDMVEA